MEISKIELSAVKSVPQVAQEVEVRTLDELQLALVGGGCGETIL
jgi:hypothetical protein